MSLSGVKCETYYDEKNKIWYGPKQKDFYGPDMTLGDVAIKVLQQNRKKIIQYHDSTQEELTAEQLLKNALSISKTFVKLGIKPRDIIGLYADNTHYLSSVVLAVWLSGAAINAVNGLLDAEVEVIYKVTRPKLIFCDVAYYKTAVMVNKNLNLNAGIYVMDGVVDNLPNVKELLCGYSDSELENFVPPCSKIDGDYSAAVMCSSGTTGPPKGVHMSHRALLNESSYQTVGADSVVFSFSTVYWISGFSTLKQSLLHGCLRIITIKPFSPDYLMDIVERHKITHIISNSEHMTKIAVINKPEWKKCMKSVNTILCGGCKIPQITRENCDDLLADNGSIPGFIVLYGMTELAAGLSCTYVQMGRGVKRAEGKLLPNKQFQILDKEGTALGVNEHGEIQIKFHYNWLGYFNNRQATDKVFKDSWFATGDIGYFDEQGYLYVRGRGQDVYKTSNVHVYPEKIEDVILRMPGLQEVCVCGIPHIQYDTVSACAIVRANTPEGNKLTEELIKTTVAKSLTSAYHLIGGVYFLDALPRTGSQKIKKRDVRNAVIKDMNVAFD